MKSNEPKNTKKNNASSKTGKKDTNYNVKALIDSMIELNKIYRKENEVLKQSNGKKFIEVQEHKYLTAIRYEEIFNELMERKEELASISPDLKNKLVAAQEEFTALQKENIKSLTRMKASTNRLSDMIRKAAVKSTNRNRSSCYSQNGSIQAKNNNKIVSTGINETA